MYQPLKFAFLLFTDYLSYILALSLAVFIRLLLPNILPFLDFPPLYPFIYLMPQAHIVPLLVVAVFFFQDLYQKRFTFWEEVLILWKSLLLAFLLVYLVMFNFNEVFAHASRVVLALAFTIMMLLTPLLRCILKNFLFFVGFWRYPVLIACKDTDLSEAERVARAFSMDKFLGYIPCGFYIPDTDIKSLPLAGKNYPVCSSIEESKNFKTSTIFIVGSSLTSEQTLLSSLYGHFRRILLVPHALFGLMHSGVQYVFSERLFIITLENKLNSLTTRIIKDIFDYIGGFLILLLCSPLFIVTALLIKITSLGPVLYRQERVGLGSRPFKIWKFRSMYVDADQKLEALLASDPVLAEEWHKYFKLSKDPRITPVGYFLRKYSIDEFPQLFNVLAGEMSLVGPRPFVKGEIEEIDPSLVPLYTQLKPGLTGLWQVSGRNNTDRIERMKIDVWYVQNWSLSLDLLILLNTPKAVLTARGAK